jgi:hypothetical protein
MGVDRSSGLCDRLSVDRSDPTAGAATGGAGGPTVDRVFRHAEVHFVAMLISTFAT